MRGDAMTMLLLPKTTVATVASIAVRAAASAALAVGVLVPLAMDAVAPASASAQAARPAELKYPRLPDFTVPKPTRFVLDNGMVVLVMEDPELPLVNVTARIRTGSLLDPAEKTGLGSIAGDQLRSGGSASMAPDALDEFLEGRAASISTSTGSDAGTASMSALKADVPDVMRVFADVLRNPRFDADRLAIAKNEAQAGIARQNDNPSAIRSREFAQVIYGEDSPFARDQTYATLNAIARDDLVAWHAKYLHPNRIILGIVGDITAAEARALVTKAFGDWKKGPPLTEKMPAPRNDAVPGVYEAVKEDSTQSFISAGHQGTLLRTHPDFYAVEVLNEVLSGGFTSRLFSNVRTAKGLAYSVGGGVGAGWTRVQPFAMSMSTKAETTVSGAEAMIIEAKDLIGSRPPKDAEVELAKSSILNSFIFNSDSRAEVLGQQITFEYYGQPVDWLDRYRAGIEKVTTADVTAAAKKYLHPDRLSIVVVGPEKGRDKPLSELGPVKKLDISIPEPPGAKPEPTKAASPAAAAQGKQLVEKAIAGLGSAAAVDGLKTYQESGTAALETPQGSMQLETTMTIAFPDRVRQEITLPMGRVVMVATPKGGFITSAKGTMALPESQQKRLRSDLARSPLVLLRARQAPDFKAIAAGSDKAGDTPVELVAIEYEGQTTTLGVEPGTGRIVSIAYQGEGPTGAPGKIVQTLSDFRPVNGLTLPFKMTSTFNGQPSTSSVTATITVNGSVDASLFEAPPEKPAGSAPPQNP